MMRRFDMLRVAVWTGVATLAACQQPRLPPELPARMVAEQTTQACINQMQNAAMQPDGIRVVLTRAAFANDDRLSIVTAPTLDAAGQLGQGRELGMPQSYRLSTSGGRCIMAREGDGKATVLDACSCVPLR
jgi:hypothetical protein